VYTDRNQLRRKCFGHEADFARLTDDLQAFHHPIAIVFEKLDAAYLAWLRSHKIGMSIGQGSNRIIWMLPTHEITSMAGT
jgi:hypothetical protein